MSKKRKSICIISFSPIARDARVLRQIEYLSPHYDVHVIGEGGAHPSWGEAVTWNPIPPILPGKRLRLLLSRLTGCSLLLAGKFHRAGHLRWYWRQPIMKDTLAKAIASGCDAFHANDWNTLPIGVEAARKLGGRVVFDDHEYAPTEFDGHSVWKMIYAPMLKRIVEHYAFNVDAMITVAPAIAERYRQEFRLDPIVLFNAPAAADRQPEKESDFNNIRIIHHGGAIPLRRLEVMIHALALCDRRFSLTFMLVSCDPAYVSYLQRLADELTPGRVTFLPPVPPEDVVKTISGFDMGFCYIAPAVFAYLVCLPNKFFDFIAAGIPVCIGPSPSMAEIVRSYDLGCIARSFEPADVAAALNGLTPERLAEMQQGARRAAREINAEREMGKLREIYDRLLAEESR
jgi:glycosyltransferase involved in cell wall biosynthesis